MKGFLVVSPAPASGVYRMMGQTWPLNDIYRQIPGLTFDRSLRCVEGRGDAAALYVAAAKERGYEVTGAVSQPPFAAPRPGVLGMHPDQQAGAGWLAAAGKEGAILGDPMGAGKTWQAIAGARLAVGPCRKLVVCPAFLRPNWRREIELRDPGASVQAIASPADWTSEKEWCIASYEAVTTVAKGTLPKFIALILDEAHYCKNHYSAQRSLAVLKVARTIPWRVGLTGTPVWNRRKDWWGVAEVVRPGGLGTFWQFARRYLLATKGPYGWDLSGPHREQPDYETVTAELAARLPWFYLRRDGLADELIGTGPGRRIVQRVARSSYTSLPFVGGPRGIDAQLRTSAPFKEEAAVELARQLMDEGRRAVVFTVLRKQAHAVAAALDWPVVTGEDAPDDRLAKAAVAESAGTGIVATLDSFGLGVNLPWASAVIFADLDWTPFKMLQAERRIYRPGQKQKPLYYYLVLEGSADEIVVGVLIDKLEKWTDVAGAPDAADMARDLGSGGEDVLAELLKKLTERE